MIARHLLGLLLVTTSAATIAAAPTDSENQYEIEVLVIENRLPELAGGESWSPDTPAGAVAANAIDPPEPTEAEPFFARAVKELGKDGHYRVLAHARWVQVADEKAASPPVRIRPLDKDSAGELEGQVQFYMSRFLHLGVNMTFRESTGGAFGGEKQVLNYRIQDARRVRHQEIHYFDHPRFGVLVRVTSLNRK
jgi:hypothetical protein